MPFTYNFAVNQHELRFINNEEVSPEDDKTIDQLTKILKCPRWMAKYHYITNGFAHPNSDEFLDLPTDWDQLKIEIKGHRDELRNNANYVFNALKLYTGE